MGHSEIIDTGLTLDAARKKYPSRRKCPADPRPRINSMFYITGDPLDVGQCTVATGQQPTKTNKKRVRGKFYPSGRPNVLPADWVLSVVYEPCSSVDDCMAELVNLLYPRAKEIKSLLRKNGYHAGFLTMVTIFEERAIYSLSASTLKRLSAFDLEWALDVL